VDSQTLGSIPKGVLEIFRKICFNFFLGEKNDNQGIHLEKWLDIAKLKGLGGWGLKKIHIFEKSLDDEIM
jgi:hypothetical protein